MTKEQKTAIERIENKLKEPRRTVKVDNTTNAPYMIEPRIYNDIDIEIVLSMLKEKDAEIEKLEQTLAGNIARNVTSSMKESAKSKEDLEMLNKGWQIELEKKDKIIDLITEFLGEQDLGYYKNETGGEIFGIMRKYNKEDWKQYFENKLNSSEQN